MINFVFALVFIGIVIASIQDLKRREVDNYVNFFILVSSVAFLLFLSIFEKNLDILWFGGLSLVVMIILANVFYYGRVFAGGDAKLMIAIFGIFVGIGLKETFVNIFSFIFLLLIAGAVYGVGWGVYLYFKNYNVCWGVSRKRLGELKFYGFLIVGVILMILGIIDIIFVFLGVFIILIPLLFAFAKAIESCSMIRRVRASALREGDWLVSKIKIRGKTIKPNWEGLTKDDLVSLKKINKIVEIKEGIPFVPVFLIAFIGYIFRSYLIGFMG